MDRLVDGVCGLDDKAMREYVQFVRDHIWQRWLVEAMEKAAEADARGGVRDAQ